nr:hypothetical protein [Tanacetum cinerariifolium]
VMSKAGSVTSGKFLSEMSRKTIYGADDEFLKNAERKMIDEITK